MFGKTVFYRCLRKCLNGNVFVFVLAGEIASGRKKCLKHKTLSVYLMSFDPGFIHAKSKQTQTTVGVCVCVRACACACVCVCACVCACIQNVRASHAEHGKKADKYHYIL